ncbi:MAG: BrnT family toxin [Heteroscytonema crispum UTEX LB 1556]
MELQFEWDDQKANRNLKKHGVSFEEAKIVFYDPLAYIFEDKWHSVDEQKEIIIGHDPNNRLLLVCFTERANVIRIISAGIATNKECKDYEQHTRF